MNTDQSRIDDLIARLSETLTVEVKRWISIDEFRRSFAARLLSAIAMADTSLSASTTRSCFCDVVTFALGGRSPAVGADLASTLRQALDLATNRSHFHVHPTISGTPARGARTGDQSMAFRKTRDIAEHDQPMETDVEGEIREFVRRDVVINPGRQPDNESQLVANDINSVLQRATATSVQEIDKLITELQAVRDMLHREAARVQREIVQYSTLTQAALQSTKTIAESLEQWRTAPDLRTAFD